MDQPPPPPGEQKKTVKDLYEAVQKQVRRLDACFLVCFHAACSLTSSPPM